MRAGPLAFSVGLVAVLGMTFAAPAQDEGGSADAPAKAKAGAPKGKSSRTGRSRSKGGSSERENESGAKLERATFGGGCFWCQEAVFERVPGVKSVVSGYSGGIAARPTYEMVCTGLTGHAEVIQVAFDPTVVSYDDLLKIFFASHDPTTRNRQGPDVGTQYRSIILYHNEEQETAAKTMYQRLAESGAFPGPIVTEIVPLKKFYPAERYHQDYYRLHSSQEYCQAEIVPKLEKLRYILRTTKFTPSSTPKP